MKVNGQPRAQAALIDLSTSPASLANWQTDRYVHPCFSNAFVTYMRDVDFSPDGSYFVIVATGGPNVGTLCDTAARWNTNATGSALEPAWVDVSGGDTLSAVAITGSVVYVGGHQRWMNNYYGSDFAGPGTVDRPGIAALDPINGMPFSWNPGRDRGKAVYGFLATNDGLWVGSDTDRIGGETAPQDRVLPARRRQDPAAHRPLHPARRPLQRPVLGMPGSSTPPSSTASTQAGRASIHWTVVRSGWPTTPTEPPVRHTATAAATPRARGASNSRWTGAFRPPPRARSSTPSGGTRATGLRCSGTSRSPPVPTCRSACT